MKRITNVTKVAWERLGAAHDGLYEYYGTLSQSLRNSALPYILASIPIVILSITGTIIVMPLIILMSTVLIFYIAHGMDEVVFLFTKHEARKAITIPLTLFISAWGITLVILAKGHMMNGVVGPYCAVLLVACAPAYRWNVNRTTRRLPLWLSLSATGILAISASLFYVDK